MFTLTEIVKAVGGQLISDSAQPKINGISIDSRTIKPGELFIAIRGRCFDGHTFIQEAINKGAKAIIAQADNCHSTIDNRAAYIRVDDTLLALGDLARWHRARFDIPVIAITGSNGKTTAKDMLAWVLSCRNKVLSNPGTQNNNIGVPLTVLKLDSSHDIVVLELGTNHFGEIAYLTNIAGPNLGLITNIGPAHLENFKDVEGVFKEKLALLRQLQHPGIAIINVDDPKLKGIRHDDKFFSLTYGIRDNCRIPVHNRARSGYTKARSACDFYATRVKLTSKKTLEFFINSHAKCDVKFRLNTVGHANVYNALAVISVTRLFGLSYRLISQRLERFVFPQGRLRLVQLKGISFIDDTYNANPVSLEQALCVLKGIKTKGRKILVMGDMLELGHCAEMEHRQMGRHIADICDVFVSVGKLAKLAALQALESGLNEDSVFTCDDSFQARDLLFRNLKPNYRDLILVKGSRLMKMEEVLRK